MYVDQFSNNGTVYLRLVKSYRAEDQDGRKVTRKKVVLNLGPLARFDDGQPDYLERLRTSYRAGQPLIPALLPYVEAPVPQKYTVTFTEGEAACIGEPKLAASILLDRVFGQLGLDKLCATLKHSERINYDLAGFLRLLLFGRVMDPASKWETTRQGDSYWSPLLACPYPYNVYDVLDVLSAHKGKFIRRMHSSIAKSVGRKAAHIFYDVTNFFFEIERPDSDEEVAGAIVKGLRQKGVSKENRKEPIVQMGLFLDEGGIPITIETFPGNTLDQATLRPALRGVLGKLGLGRFVLVADRGMHSYYNLCRLVADGQGYIVSKSIKKTTAAEREWILDQEGYRGESGAFRLKSRVICRKVKDEDGNLRELKEKVIVYWSERFYRREYREHQSFLEFIEKLRQNPSSFRVTATQSKVLRKYFKQEFVHKETGEVIKAGKLLGMLDEAKLEALTAFMGYYQIVTSETGMPDEEVIDAYHGLTQIEDQFREMKGTLRTRPVYVSTREHIEAHLLLCLMALTMLRLIQKKLTTNKKAEARLWGYGMSGRRVQSALKKWQLEKLPGDLYRFCHTNDNDLQQILAAYSVNVQRKLYTRGEIRALKASITL